MNNGVSSSAINDIPEANEHGSARQEHEAGNETILPIVIEPEPEVEPDAARLQFEASKELRRDLHIVLDTLVYLELSTIYYLESV